MVVPPKHPKMIIFSSKTPWLLGTSILGNLHIAALHSKIIEMKNWSISNSSYLSTTTPFSIKNDHGKTITPAHWGKKISHSFGRSIYVYVFVTQKMVGEMLAIVLHTNRV